MSDRRPPRLLEWILERTLPGDLSGQAALGDLAEEYVRRASTSLLRARLWYVYQAVSIVLYRLFAGRGERASSRDSDFFADLRWSARLITRHPGFALGVVAILGLGMGADIAVFSVVDGTFQNTSWWKDPDRMVAVWPEREFGFGQLTLYQGQQSAYRTLGGYTELAFALRTPEGESISVNGVALTPSLFRELAAQPRLGRALADDDAVLGTAPVAVIGESLWRRVFGADPGVLGRTVEVGGAPVTVVGVQAPGGMAPGGRAELWLPLVLGPMDDDYWQAQNLTVVGALRDGADLDDAFADLMAFNDHLSGLYPAFYPPGFAEGLANVARADQAQRRLISTPLLLLLGGTSLLLLVTALNVGNLLLGRALERRRELAVRVAIGAGRARIVRQLTVEAGVLTALATMVALGAGALGAPFLARLFVGETVVASSSVLSLRVLVFVLPAALVAWLFLGGVPLAHFLRGRRLGLEVRPDSSGRIQQTLVAVQAALATLLLVSAALLVATVDNLRRVPLGFEEQGLLTVELSPPTDRVETLPQARALYDGLVERVEGLPGVEAAGVTGWLPLRAQAPTTPINLQVAPVEPAQAVWAPMHLVDPGFFRAMGVHPTQGRLLNSQDREFQPSAVVVNETLAEILWPRGGAVGQLMAIDPHAWDRWVPVVGVIPDIRSGEITEAPEPALYVSLAESPARDVTLVVRTDGQSSGLIPGVRRAVSHVDPLVPIRSITWMSQVVRSAYSTSWVVMGLLVALALLATALGAIGIYAVMAHHVATNKKEIGVRMALGAQPSSVVGRVVRSGLILAGVGILAGSVAAALASRFLESLLFQVSALAPAAYAAPALALLLAAAVATWLPAARAGKLPPAEVLRTE